MLKNSVGIRVFALTVVLASGVHMGFAQDAQDVINQSFKVQTGGTLFLDIDQGDVEIVARRGGEVLVDVERTVEGRARADAAEIFSRHQVSFNQEQNDVRIEARNDQERSNWPWGNRSRLRVRFRIQVPDQYNVTFTSGAGNITVTGVSGAVDGTTGAGNMIARTVRGPLELRSGSGNVNVVNAIGTIRVSTGAGNVDLRDVQGGVNAATGAGNVIARITGQPETDSRLESGAGNVSVFLAGQIGVDVNATAAVGSLDTDFPLQTSGRWMSRSAEGRINGGGPEMSLRTGVGNVAVRRL
jgi:hypothetical protein